MKIFNKIVTAAIFLCTFTHVPLVLGMETQEPLADHLSSTIVVKIRAMSEKVKSHNNSAKQIVAIFEIFRFYEELLNPLSSRCKLLFSSIQNTRDEIFQPLYNECNIVNTKKFSLYAQKDKLSKKFYSFYDSLTKDSNVDIQLTIRQALQKFGDDAIVLLQNLITLTDQIKQLSVSIAEKKSQVVNPVGKDRQDKVIVMEKEKTEELNTGMPIFNAQMNLLKPLLINQCDNGIVGLAQGGIDDISADKNAETIETEIDNFRNDIYDSDKIINMEVVKCQREESTYLNRDVHINAPSRDAELLFREKIPQAVEKAKKQKEDLALGTTIKKEMEAVEKQMKQKELNKKVSTFFTTITDFLFSEGGGIPYWKVLLPLYFLVINIVLLLLQLHTSKIS